PGRLQAGDQLVVREAVRARAGVDPHDPESPEGPLLVLAVTVGVGERVLDLLLRVAVRGLLQPPVALRLGENLAALLARVDGSLDARHLLPHFPAEQLAHRARVGSVNLAILPEPALPFLRLLLEVVALPRTPAEARDAARC